MDTKKVEMQRLNLDLPREVIEKMKEHSKKHPACFRKNKGNAALFARLAIYRLLRDTDSI